MKHIRSGIIFGVIGGLFTLLFGGWSVLVIGGLMGLGLGLFISRRLQRKTPYTLVLDALPAVVVSGIVLITLSLFENNVVEKAIGHSPQPPTIVLQANLAGFLGG